MNQDNFGPQIGQESMPPVNNPKKKSPIGAIVGVLVVLCILGVGAYFLLNKTDLLKKEDKKDTKTEEKETKKEETKKEEKVEEKKDTKFNGVYTFGENKLTLYNLGNGEVWFTLIAESHSSGNAKIKGDTATEKIFDSEYTFTISGDDIIVSVNDNEKANGTYKKEKDYNDEDYFEDNLGKKEYLNTKYNGLYKLDKNKLYMYQKDSSSVRIVIMGDNGIFDIPFEIKEDGSLYAKFFDDEYGIELGNDKVTFKSIKVDNEDKKEKDGVYIKEKSLTMDDILKELRD